MSALYTNLSEVYEAMYQTFINYEDEFNFYSALLKKYNCQSVLEIGCGTGNLAHRFKTNQFDYTGLDLSADMLDIAKRNNPSTNFEKGDMRSFDLPKPVQSCIITGRSISYLVTDEDVQDSFRSIHKNLTTKPGVLCFDFIDASKFIPLIKNGKKVTHEAVVKNKKYHRESFWKIGSRQNGSFDWRSVFYEEADGSLKNIGEDQSTIRSFTRDEMITFLQLSGFQVKEIIPRHSYAFDTLVIAAEKVFGS